MDSYGRLWLALWIISLLVKLNFAANCDASGTTVGVSDPNSFQTSAGSSSDVGYLIEDSEYQVQCCGIVNQWEVYAFRTGSVDTQIWRKTSSSQYTLVGENTISLTAVGEYLYTVPNTSSVSVEPGDYIGWYSSGTEVISYTSGSNYTIMNRRKTSLGDRNVGDVEDWSNVNPEVSGDNRQYAIRAIVKQGSTPQFSFGTSTTVTVPENTASGTAVYIFTVTDDDPQDTVVMEMVSTDNSFFSLNTTHKHIVTTQASIPDQASYIMTVKIFDDCLLTQTATVTLTVPNTALTINNLPATVTVDEEETSERKLLDLNVTEEHDGYTCDLTTSNVPFVVKQISTASPPYGVYLVDWPQLVYTSQSSYTLSVSCEDGTVTATGSVTVNVIRSQQPTVTNTNWAVALDATTAKTSDVIFTVNATDADSSQLTYSISCTPSECPLDVLNSGKIVLNDRLLNHGTSSYSVAVTVSDGSNNVGSNTISMTINNLNNVPVLSNLPSSITVVENTALGTSVFTVTATDTDGGDPKVFAASFDPAWVDKYFQIDNSSGIVYTSSATMIDFDILSNTLFIMYITVTDGKSYDTEQLTIQIQNQNEAPTFSQTHYSSTRNEGSSASAFPTPRWNVFDPDQGDSATYTLNCGSDTSRFSINSNSGAISFNGEYNLDDGTSPEEVNCTVTVTDVTGLSDDCALTLQIRHVNEYIIAFPYSSYAFTVEATQSIGTIVYSVNFADQDLSTHSHGKVYHSMTSNTYFDIANNGSVYVKSDLSVLASSGLSLSLTVTAVDLYGNSASVPVVITVPVYVNTTDTDTTERPYMILEKAASMAWFAPTAFATLTFVSIFCYKTVLSRIDWRRPRCDRCRRRTFFRPLPVQVVLPKPKNLPKPRPPQKEVTTEEDLEPEETVEELLFGVSGAKEVSAKSKKDKEEAPAFYPKRVKNPDPPSPIVERTRVISPILPPTPPPAYEQTDAVEQEDKPKRVKVKKKKKKIRK